MSNDIQKSDQIAFHFYTKLFYVVNQARATAEPRTQGKVDKWFNLETQDSDLFTKEAKEPYKNISQARPPGPPPLELQVVLTIPELAHNQVLVYLTPDSSRARIEPTPKYIVLETFTLTFTPHNVDPASVDVALPTIYKHGIPLFRSLYSLLRVLPVWKLCSRLKRRVGRNGALGIQLRVKPARETASILAFDMPPSPSLSTPFATQAQVFSKVPHPLGFLVLSVRYLCTPEFHLEELESVLSSRFISQDLDGAEGFVPTLTKNHNRDSSIISTTSSTTNTRSPPKNIIARAVSTGAGDVADRFILPARTASTGAGSGAHQIQPARQTATGDFVGYGAPTAPVAVAHSPPSGLAMARLRKESTGSSASSSFRDNISHNANPSLSSLSSSPSSGPMSIRRPNPTPVNPFKSNTVLSSSTAGSSPSLSIRQAPLAGSPLSTGLAMGASGHGHSRSTSVSSITAPPGAGVPSSFGSRHPPSPIGMGFAPGSRPSPSNQADKRPGTAGSTGSGGSAMEDTKDRGGEGVAIPTRKRYSSSFGHRYVGSVGSQGVGLDAAGSAQGGSSGRGTPASSGNQPGGSGLGIEGVTGGGGGDREGAMTSSLLSQHAGTDDDDISVFVQEIEARKLLSGRRKENEDRDRRRAGSAGSGKSPERRRSTLGYTSQPQPLQREDTVRETYRQPLSMGGRFGPEATITSSPAPSAPSSRFSTATGSSSTTVTQGSTATVTPSTNNPEPEASTSPPAASLSPTRGPILTSRGEVDERLRKMNETFLKSLEGISGAGTNEAKRKERERKREREREEADRLSRRNSGQEETREPSTSSNPASPIARDDGGRVDFPARPPLSFRATPLAGSPTVTPATPVAISGNGREDRGSYGDDDEGGRGRWVPYSMGMGLRRAYGEGEGGGQEGNSSLLSQGGSVGQGSEEVIGKMDFLYEGPRTKDAYYDRR